MPHVLVTTDDGQVMHRERVCADDFATDHFRRCISERLAWAVADAQNQGDEEPGLVAA